MKINTGILKNVVKNVEILRQIIKNCKVIHCDLNYVSGSWDIYTYINASANSVMLYFLSDYCNIVFKSKHKFYITLKKKDYHIRLWVMSFQLAVAYRQSV